MFCGPGTSQNHMRISDDFLSSLWSIKHFDYIWKITMHILHVGLYPVCSKFPYKLGEYIPKSKGKGLCF